LTRLLAALPALPGTVVPLARLGFFRSLVPY